jgi:hypothetical protein
MSYCTYNIAALAYGKPFPSTTSRVRSNIPAHNLSSEPHYLSQFNLSFYGSLSQSCLCWCSGRSEACDFRSIGKEPLKGKERVDLLPQLRTTSKFSAPHPIFLLLPSILLHPLPLHTSLPLLHLHCFYILNILYPLHNTFPTSSRTQLLQPLPFQSLHSNLCHFATLPFSLRRFHSYYPPHTMNGDPSD